ncbi:efflux RND transporter periplasmic adaptor subunit [bacterium]|nr:MAG: efflux RND transporter periplasmic adaptor subunit [bacterium]
MKKLITILSGMAIVAGIILTIQAISAPQAPLESNVDLSQTYQVSREDIAEKVLASGKVISSEDITDLSFDKTGIVKNIFVKEGNRVERDDILMAIENVELGNRKIQALAQIKNAQIDLDNVLSSGSEVRKPNQVVILNAQNNLKTIRSLANSNIRLAENQVNVAQAEVDVANKNFDNIQDEINSTSGLVDTNYENIISETYFTLDNNIWFLNKMQEKYFYRNDQISFKIKEKESETLKSYYSAKWYYESYLDGEDPVDWLIREMPEKISEALKGTEETYRLLLTSFDKDPLYQNILTDDDSDDINKKREEINKALSKINQLSNNQNSSDSDLQTLFNLAQERKESAQLFLSNAEQNLANIRQESQNLINQAEDLLRRAYDQVIISFKPANASAIETARQKLIQAQNNYNQLLGESAIQEITSPIKGIIKEININVGDLLQKNVSVFKIDVSDNLGIRAEIKDDSIKNINLFDGRLKNINLFDGRLKNINLFDEVIIKSADFPQKTSQGIISKIESKDVSVSPEVCAKNKVECLELEENMTVNLEILIREKKNALVVPKEFLTEQEGKNFVKLKKGGAEILQEVRIGIINGKFVEILEGIEENDVIYLP